MRLAKRATAVVLSAAMLVSGLYVGNTAKAHTAYETKGVYISTDLVPQDSHISVKNGEVPTITTDRNVKFTLDCNVDCTWKVDNYGVDEGKQEEAAKKFAINEWGEVTIAADAVTATYTISATGKKYTTNSNKKALCYITVESPAVEGTVTLDKERIEAINATYDKKLNDGDTSVATVSEDGLSLIVNGYVSNMPLYTKITPEYVANTNVTFDAHDVEEATITEGAEAAGVKADDKLTTNKKTTDKGISLDTKCGNATSSKINLIINERSYKARIDCDEISTEDKDLTKNIYNIRLNEDINFKLSDNEKFTLPQNKVGRVEWLMAYGAKNESIDTSALVNGVGTVNTDLGTFIFSNKGKDVNLLTPLNDENDAAYKKYMERIKDAESSSGAKEITLDAKVYDEEDHLLFTLNQVILNFSKDDNNFSEIKMDFAAAGLTEGIDYIVKEDTIADKKVNVYYFESGETRGNVLDLVEATQANVLGVRDFEASQKTNFNDNSTYIVKYSLQELTAVDEVYRNKDILDATKNTEINANNKQLTTADGTLTKQGTGYFNLHVVMTGKKELTADCVIRFVSSAANLTVQHKNYTKDDDLEYDGNAVIHIRQGEADVPTVSVGGKETAVTLADPFLKFEVTKVIKSKEASGKVAKAHTETDGSFKINGISEGKVVVTATSIVDATETTSYILYVNDETLKLEKGQLEIDLTDARAMGRISASGEVQGHWEDIPLKVTVKNVPNAGIPEVNWSIVSENGDAFATIKKSEEAEDTAILATLKSTGTGSITVRAATVYDPEVYAEQEITIKDVYATKIVEIGEKVVAGKTGVMTNVADNAGTAKVGQQFTLEPKTYEPKNSTGVNGGITWTSSDPSIATVDENGLVTTLAEGTVKIEAKYTSNTSTETTTFNLTVSGYDQVVEKIECEDSIVLTRVGDTKTLVVTVLPENVVNKAVTYAVTEGEDIVSVNESGVVTALKVGKAVITITSVLTPSVTKKVNVEVKGEDDITPNNTPAPTQPGVQNTPVPTPKAPAKNAKVTVSGSTYVVTNASTSKGEVTFQKAKSGKNVKVPDTVKINGYTYKVTSIKAKAFKGNKKLKSVTIGKNVKSIGKQAFYGCKKLTKVTIKSTVLKSVGAKAFAKGSKKITVTAPKKKVKAYKKLLKKAGISKKAKYKKK